MLFGSKVVKIVKFCPMIGPLLLINSSKLNNSIGISYKCRPITLLRKTYNYRYPNIVYNISLGLNTGKCTKLRNQLLNTAHTIACRPEHDGPSPSHWGLRNASKNE